ncbi:hypothetical protein ACOME3_001326 [Neoechinorhynchus agilis]
MLIYEQIASRPLSNVQRDAAKFQLHQDVCLTIPAILVLVIFANHSINLKLLVIISLGARIVSALCSLLTAYHQLLPLESLVTLCCLRGTLVPSVHLFAAIIGHVTKHSKIYDRSMNLGLIEGAILLGSGCGYIVAGVITTFCNPNKTTTPFTIVLTLYCFSGLLVIKTIENKEPIAIKQPGLRSLMIPSIILHKNGQMIDGDK